MKKSRRRKQRITRVRKRRFSNNASNISGNLRKTASTRLHSRSIRHKGNNKKRKTSLQKSHSHFKNNKKHGKRFRIESVRNFFQRIPTRKKYFRPPIGNKIDTANQIFFTGKHPPKNKYQSIALLSKVQVTGYADKTKSVLWWRRMKEPKPMTLLQWRKKLNEEYLADLQYQIEDSGGTFLELIGIEGLK